MRRSLAKRPNTQLGNWTDWIATKRKTNLDFFATAIRTMAKYHIGNRGKMTIGLVGSRDLPGVTLRRSQSILRWDRRPSLWSHAFLIGEAWDGKQAIGDLPILEVPLFARTLTFPLPERNGVMSNSTLGLYADGLVDANVALLAVCRREFESGCRCGLKHLTDAEAKTVEGRAGDYNYDRMRYNFWENLSAWQRYLWSDGEGENPLRAGVPVCAASFIEMAFESIGLDIVPAISEQNSAPEHIWNAARWWHQDSHLDEDDAASRFEMQGCFALRDPGCSMLDASDIQRSSGPSPKPKRKRTARKTRRSKKAS